MGFTGWGMSLAYPTSPPPLQICFRRFAFENPSLRMGDSHFSLSSEEYDCHRVNPILSIVIEFVDVFSPNSLVFSLLPITVLKIPIRSKLRGRKWVLFILPALLTTIKLFPVDPCSYPPPPPPNTHTPTQPQHNPSKPQFSLRMYRRLFMFLQFC